MCYDIKTKLEAQLKRAKHYNKTEWIKELERKLEPFQENEIFHASGYAHPTLLIYSNEHATTPTPSTWGLVPHWVKDNKKRFELWNKTLNARGETIFEKPSFRQSAKSKRCIIPLDGFYEHHHFNGKPYPYLIRREDGEPLMVAGLWNEWLDTETGELINTCTIVTTKANQLLSKIHNNPKLPESRMPVLLNEADEDRWLDISGDASNIESLKKLIQPLEDGMLVAHTVQKLSGKAALGNIAEAAEYFKYDELKEVG
jgi:putative SOS response-associated peptidase YedK